MDDLEFLRSLKEYVELVQVQLDAEYGDGRTLEQLVAAGDMPSIYAEVLRRLDAPL